MLHVHATSAYAAHATSEGAGVVLHMWAACDGVMMPRHAIRHASVVLIAWEDDIYSGRSVSSQAARAHFFIKKTCKWGVGPHTTLARIDSIATFRLIRIAKCNRISWKEERFKSAPNRLEGVGDLSQKNTIDKKSREIDRGRFSLDRTPLITRSI